MEEHNNIGGFGTDNWRKSLQNIVCHEFAHAVSLNFNNRNTIGDDVVFEGIAEHFREDLMGAGKSPWVQSISEKEAKQIFQEIKPKIKINSNALYRELFFGTGKFPLWSGYAIGYYLVGNYLNKCARKNWVEIFTKQPTEIIEKSDY